MGRRCLFQALFIYILLVLVLSDFLYFEKGSMTPPILTKPALLEVKHLWSFLEHPMQEKGPGNHL